MNRLKALSYRANRRLIGAIIRPRTAGADTDFLRACAISADDAPPLLYALENRSLSDLIVLDLVTEQLGLPGPLDAVAIADHEERRRFFFLSRASHGWFRRNTMSRYSTRMVDLLQQVARHGHAVPGSVIPVAIFWGRAPGREGSLLRALLSENWAVTPRLKRLVNLFLSRRDILVQFGAPLPLAELAVTGGDDGSRTVRRAARLLRVRLRNQRVAARGPDLSHQRTLADQILRTRTVRAVIAAQSGTESAEWLEYRARRYAAQIASNLSYPTIRILERILRWFWNRIYQGVEVHEIQRVKDIAETHTLVYVPSHRSHLDYLLLSYQLYQHGLMIPHIAAGDNLNLPVLGSILRRAGAFFMRRSFRDDALYAAVFAEYLYQVYRRGHSVEFFPEGGRTRTGRLLPARIGLLKMTLEHHQRGIPRPLALVPVYFGYEKLVEAGSYLDELKGAEKRRESVVDVMRGLRLIRQNFGKVDVKFGLPLILGQWLPDRPEDATGSDATDPFAAVAIALGQEVMKRINASAALNPVNLIALITLCMPKLAIEERTLEAQLHCYLDLLRADAMHHDFTLPQQHPAEMIRHLEDLGLLVREPGSTGGGDVLSHTPFNAVLMTWYRNNIAHVLALPSLIACLVKDRRRPARPEALIRMATTVFPYISRELQAPFDAAAVPRWLRHMHAAGLLMRDTDGGYSAAPASRPEHYRLRLLGRVIMPTLERLYIVISLLSHNGPGTLARGDLQRRSGEVARRMSRLYGLNAPEFFDAALFNQFVDTLLENGVVSEQPDGTLLYQPLVDDVLRASESVIDPEFRFAVHHEQ